jgi:hypothetical protein
MASNFAFQPYGLSRRVTVGGGAPATISLDVVGLGGVTATVGGANRYQTPGVRIVNNGTASVFLQFGPSPAATVTTGVNTGMEMLSNSIEVFSVRGHQFLAAVCASTFTVTLGVTPGEGL